MPLDAKDPPQKVYSVCPHDCPSTCALEVEFKSEREIGRVRGHPDHPYTQGVICAKVARYAERIHHPDRLLYPLRRVGEKGCGIDGFERISWEDALDSITEQFLRIEERYGGEAIWPYYFAGTMGHVQRDGLNRLRHAKKYSGMEVTICTTLPESGWFAGVGEKSGVDVREIEQSEVVIIWGGNPVNTQVNVMHYLTKAKRNGAKVIVVDPYRTGTAEQADILLPVRPGTDAALAAAMIHVILKEGLEDQDYLARLTDWDEEAEAHFAGKTPAWAETITGIPATQIEEVARLFGSTKKAYIRVGYGFARARNGAASLHAVSCLPSVTGAWQAKGGGALWGHGAIYHLDKTLIEGLDVKDPTVRELDMSRIGPVLTGDKTDLGAGPPVMGLLVQNTNPAVVCPEVNKVLAGFAREDLFTVVHEQFLTETARLADIVLPASMFLEHDDYYTASGHPFLQVARKVMEAPGEARENHFVHCELAKRLGAEHPGFEMTAWEVIEETLRLSGHPTAETVHQGLGEDCSRSFEEAHFLNGFPQPDGRFHFKANWAAIGTDTAGMPILPDHAQQVWDGATPDRPYRLVAAPARAYLNTSFTETPGSMQREGRPEAMIHPDDCETLGIREGDRVRIGNALGDVLIHVRAFDGLQPGVVVVESVHPNEAFIEGVGINALISADRGKPRGGAVFHDTAVWIKRA